MQNFQAFGLPKPLLDSLRLLKFSKPTPIQEQSIPLALEGKDILGSAQTGTGKTAAFGIPLVAKLLDDPDSTAIVITPTRELATQVMKAMQGFLGRKSDIQTALLIGGEPIQRQLQQLRRRPRLFVGTPGRINDHLRSRKLSLNNTRYLVLDETDRMLDMGFSIQIEDILKHIPDERQTLLFSATLPHNIVSMAASYMKDPVRIAIGRESNPAQNIKHDVLHVKENDKFPQLLAELERRAGSIIVFVKTKFGAEKMATRLRDEGHDADTIHGDLRHSKRERVIKAFRNRRYRILVATDVAARGLDIPHIEHVINFDLPQCPEDYIHRIGRTARAGAEGEAVCFVAPTDRSKWRAVHRLIDPEAAEEQSKHDRAHRGRGRDPRSGAGYKSKPGSAHKKGGRKFNGDRGPRPERAERADGSGGGKSRQDGAPRPDRNKAHGGGGQGAGKRQDKGAADRTGAGRPDGARADGKRSAGPRAEGGKRDGNAGKFKQSVRNQRGSGRFQAKPKAS
jgi:superfamily II DNA/RNA helicase